MKLDRVALIDTLLKLRREEWATPSDETNEKIVTKAVDEFLEKDEPVDDLKDVIVSCLKRMREISRETPVDTVLDILDRDSFSLGEMEDFVQAEFEAGRTYRFIRTTPAIRKQWMDETLENLKAELAEATDPEQIEHLEQSIKFFDRTEGVVSTMDILRMPFGEYKILVMRP